MPKKAALDDDNETPGSAQATAAYEEAIQAYGSAIEKLRAGAVAEAKALLLRVVEQMRDEPELAERARTYLRVCEQRSAPREVRPTTAEGCYHAAVVRLNRREIDEAIDLLDEALRQEPRSVRCLYARASAMALKGLTDRAVENLRQAIAFDATVRFQAINDPDFEKIREEPAFIDIVEPTPTGH